MPCNSKTLFNGAILFSIDESSPLLFNVCNGCSSLPGNHRRSSHDLSLCLSYDVILGYGSRSSRVLERVIAGDAAYDRLLRIEISSSVIDAQSTSGCHLLVLVYRMRIKKAPKMRVDPRGAEDSDFHFGSDWIG